MTARTNARLAGTAYLLYIAAGIASMIVFRRATGGAEGTAAQLASIAQNAPLVGLTVIFALVMAVCAVTLGVSLHALTRDEDRDIALFGLSFRVVEGAVNALAVTRPLQLLALANASLAATGADAAAVNAFGGLFLRGGRAGGPGAFLFGLGSLCFCFLLLRARSIPAWLAWLGVLSSVLWVIGIPLQLAGFIGGAATYALWIPMGVFEIVFGVWLIAAGVRVPDRTPSFVSP
jgi:hypothetical protein